SARGASKGDDQELRVGRVASPPGSCPTRRWPPKTCLTYGHAGALLSRGLWFQWLESSGCQDRPQEAPYPGVGPAHSLRCTDTSVRSTPPEHRRCTSASPSP